MHKVIDGLGSGIAQGVQSMSRAFQGVGSSITRGIEEVFNPGRLHSGDTGGGNGTPAASDSNNSSSGTANNATSSGTSSAAPTTFAGVNGLAPRAESLRARGNEALTRRDFAQALNLYTQAIHVQVRRGVLRCVVVLRCAAL